MTILQLASRVLLAVVFVVAAVSKGRTRRKLAEFAAGLEPYRWVPPGLRSGVAGAVIAVEMLTAGLLLVAQATGAILSLGLLVTFTVATLRAGKAAACQCFGAPNAPGDNGSGLFLARNIFLGSAALLAALPPAEGATVPQAAVAVSVGGLVAVLVIGLEDAVYLLRTLLKSDAR